MASNPPYANATWSNIARMLARSVMFPPPNPMAGPQPDNPVPATPMPTPYLASISRAVACAASALRSTHTMCAPSLTNRCAVSLPIPEPAPITTWICRASSFSAGIRWSFASSSNQYSMSNASCCGSAMYSSMASAPRITSTAQL